MPALDDRLAAARTDLLHEIDQPDLAVIGDRAVRLRRRRAASRTGAALLALVAVGALVARPWTGDQARPPEPAATVAPAPTAGSVYTSDGITVNGLVLGLPVIELPGTLVAAEFADPDHGWVLATECGGCSVTVGRTVDGGRNWTSRALGPPGDAQLVALDPETVLVRGSERTMLSTSGGLGWQLVDVTSRPVDAMHAGDRPIVNSNRTVEVWAPSGYRGDLAVQPPFTPTWISAAPAADGGWWVGGDDAALAVTRDRGRSWKRYTLPTTVPGNHVEVTALGVDVYAIVVDTRDTPAPQRGIYRSTAGGPFVRVGPATPPQTIGGQVVPLLDGRLLVSNGFADNSLVGNWYVSADHGVTFTAARNMPQVGTVRRTPSGYVAFDVVADGWVAYSSDGATWRKLQVH